MSDGLPIVPPTVERVAEFLRFCDRPGETELGVLLPDKRHATVWNVAVNGVMAGCRPEYMPILVALVEAMADPRYGVEHSGNTPGAETLIILNGPLIKEQPLPRRARGRHALAAPPRRARLPSEQSTVTVLRAETVINVTGGLDEVASVIGSRRLALRHPAQRQGDGGPLTVHRPAARGGRMDPGRRAPRALHRTAPGEMRRRSWIHATVRAGDWPEWVRVAAESGSIPAVRDPDDLTLIVAGTDLPIPQHAYCPSWGHPPCRVTREIAGRGSGTTRTAVSVQRH